MTHACQRRCPPGMYQGDPNCQQCQEVTRRLSAALAPIVADWTVYGDVIHVPEDFRLPDLRNNYPSPK